MLSNQPGARKYTVDCKLNPILHRKTTWCVISANVVRHCNKAMWSDWGIIGFSYNRWRCLQWTHYIVDVAVLIGSNSSSYNVDIEKSKNLLLWNYSCPLLWQLFSVSLPYYYKKVFRDFSLRKVSYLAWSFFLSFSLSAMLLTW